MTQTEALKLASRAINNLIASSHLTDPQPWRDARQDSVAALTAIKEALAQPEQEQRCYCGEIYNLGVIHRDDGPCHYPEHTSEYKRGYADAMNWKAQNHLEHLQPKVRTGDCLLTGVCASEGHKIQPKEPEQEPVAWMTPAGEGFRIRFSPPVNDVPLGWDALYTTPPQRTWVGLSESDRRLINFQWQDGNGTATEIIDLVEAKLKEKNNGHN